MDPRVHVPSVHPAGKVPHVLAADRPRLVQGIAGPSAGPRDENDRLSLRQLLGVETRHRNVESVRNVTGGKFVRLADVHHRPGVGSNCLFQVAKTDDVLIRASAEA